jgi:hypothetical protein
MSTNGENSAEVTAFLRERYGNKGSQNWVRSWILPALIFAVLGGAWMIWSGTHAANPEIRTTLLSFDSSSPASIRIRYSITVKHPVGNHQCTLVARDAQKNTVGEIVDHIPLGVASITHEVAIPTRLQAVNAAVLSCASL